MTVTNDTPLADALAIGMGPDRQPHLAVVVKATLQLPDAVDGPLVPAEAPRPVVTADEFFDGDLMGSVRTEAERYVYKPRADVLVVGSAHAPEGHTATALNVALRVGTREWALRVTGDRRWIFPTRAMLVPIASEPEPFQSLPLRWERAFGGLDLRAARRSAENPVGRGLIGSKTRESVDGQPLPNVESPGALVSSWDDEPPAVGFGPVRKDWAPRAALAGRLVDRPHPVFGLPEDFDHAFYNGAPRPLQVPFLDGTETIELQHLTPGRYLRCRLPGWRPEVTLALSEGGGPAPLALRLDTLVLYPDDGVLTLTWRDSRPLARLDALGIDGYTVQLGTASAS